MEWVSRKVFERGYWKSGADRPEIEVLDAQESEQLTDGQIEDDKEEKSQYYYGVKFDGLYDASGIPRDEDWRVSPKETTLKRWTRIIRCAVDIAGVVPGFVWAEGTREWRVEGKLADKVASWREMERIEREEEEKRRMGKRWIDDDELMDVDGELEEESSEDDENDSQEVRELKVFLHFLFVPPEILTWIFAGSSTLPSRPPSVCFSRTGPSPAIPQVSTITKST